MSYSYIFDNNYTEVPQSKVNINIATFIFSYRYIPVSKTTWQTVPSAKGYNAINRSVFCIIAGCMVT